MTCFRVLRDSFWLVAVATTVVWWPSAVVAQRSPVYRDLAKDARGYGYVYTDEGAMHIGGVLIDEAGHLQLNQVQDARGDLTRKRRAAAQAVLDGDLAKPSPFRKVSLKRLEAAISAGLSSGRALTHEMRFLAGLTRLQYVFFLPETGDVVIAGPAEGYMLDLANQPVGLVTGQPILELQDLLIALRAFPPQDMPATLMAVSIDPTAEGIANAQRFLAGLAPPTPGQLPQITRGLRQAFGAQQVRIHGISPKTHFALVLVEADYRLKLISLGVEIPPVKIRSYPARAEVRDLAAGLVQRFFFTPAGRSVKVSDDQLAMELMAPAL